MTRKKFYSGNPKKILLTAWRSQLVWKIISDSISIIFSKLCRNARNLSNFYLTWWSLASSKSLITGINPHSFSDSKWPIKQTYSRVHFTDAQRSDPTPQKHYSWAAYPKGEFKRRLSFANLIQCFFDYKDGSFVNGSQGMWLYREDFLFATSDTSFIDNMMELMVKMSRSQFSLLRNRNVFFSWNQNDGRRHTIADARGAFLERQAKQFYCRSQQNCSSARPLSRNYGALWPGRLAR